MKKSAGVVIAILLGTCLQYGCAGSPPDYSQRTSHAVLKQSELAEWLSQDAKRKVSNPIVAPVCSNDVGRPPTGWALENESWCVVACPAALTDTDLNQWVTTNDSQRCFVTDLTANALVTTEYEPAHWQLETLDLFTGFDRSFVSDTEWNCIEQEYQIDPETQQGFWVYVGAGNTYRFYNDGALMLARAGSPMKHAGDWRGKQGSGVVVNDREMFRFAVNYSGGHFDEYRTATQKQVCRFKDHPGPRI